MDLDELNRREWHDSVIVEIVVHRALDHDHDAISLRIDWASGGRSTLRLSNCRRFTANMNFGIIARETILDADVSMDHPAISIVRDTWRPLDALPDSEHSQVPA